MVSGAAPTDESARGRLQPLPGLPPTFGDATPLVNALALRRDPLAFFTRLAKVGNFAHFELPAGPVYFVNDPTLIREVLVTGDANFRKWEIKPGLHEIVGEGLLTSEGAKHQAMARMVRPAFRQGRMPEYARRMVELTVQRMEHWPENGETALDQEMILLTLDVVAETLFGVTLGEHREEIHAASRTVQIFGDRLGTAPDDDACFQAAVARLDTVAGSILAERRRTGQADNDLLALLLHGQEAEPELVTDAQIRAEIRTFLMAGHVTTANMIAAACWQLARDPTAQAALHQQIADALPDRWPRPEDLPLLSPCEHVLLETLRLYPPMWLLGREAKQEVNLGGYQLPKGAKVVIVPWLLHRAPQTFPTPERFRPDRWQDDARARLPRGSYLPFSAGSRSCLGERFAMLEGILVLAILAKYWQFGELPDRPDPGWHPQRILWPRRGIRLHIRRRPAVTSSTR